MTASGCGFNRSTQHLISKYREEDVENEIIPGRNETSRDKFLSITALVRETMYLIAHTFSQNHEPVLNSNTNQLFILY